MSAKDAYIKFCTQEYVPLFLQPWWLNAVTQPDNKQWNVILAYDKLGNIQAAMPYLYGRKLWIKYVLTPQLTQYTGVWIKDIQAESTSERLSREKHLQGELIRQLETMCLDFFEVRFPLTYQNWLPFYWAGYQQETHYTYRIEDLCDTGSIFKRFDYAKQKQIHKAEQAGLCIDFDMCADEFYELHRLQWGYIGKRDVLSRALVKSVIECSRRREQGMIVRAKDADGNTHAAIFVVWDKHSAYDLMSAIHPAYRSSGASTLVVWEAMKKLKDTTQSWDFEGSMIETVENSFRQFGATPTPYFQISKYSKIISLFRIWRR